jgi:predicted thioesterase
MKDTLKPGLTASLDYEVTDARTVPALLPESEYFAALPPVLATGYLVFDVVARDDAGEVRRGQHRRAVIDLERFTTKLAQR